MRASPGLSKDSPKTQKQTPRKPSQTSTVTPSKATPSRPPLQPMQPTVESPNHSFDMSASLRGPASVWDDGEMSFDLITEDDGGPIDEEVCLSNSCKYYIHTDPLISSWRR